MGYGNGGDFLSGGFDVESGCCGVIESSVEADLSVREKLIDGIGVVSLISFLMYGEFGEIFPCMWRVDMELVEEHGMTMFGCDGIMPYGVCGCFG